MTIDVSDILKEEGLSKTFAKQLRLEDFDYQGEKLSFPASILVEGEITNTAGILLLDARVNGAVILQCGACMENFRHGLDFSFNAKLKASPEDQDPDIFVYDDQYIEIKSIVEEFFLLNLPIRKRCREDCMGLCPKCGKKLYNSRCNCETNVEENLEDEIDSRMSVLKDYFSAQGKEV